MHRRSFWFMLTLRLDSSVSTNEELIAKNAAIDDQSKRLIVEENQRRKPSS